jgi:hypothetical protein
VKTDDLIRQLAAGAAPVRRLRPPWLRAVAWLAIASAYVALVVLLHPGMPQVTRDMLDLRMIVEWCAAVATALTAAWTAFCSTVPGYDRRLLWLPVVPALVWGGSLGAGCLGDWLRYGPDGVAIHADWACLPPAILIGSVPLVVILAMLRRGAPLRPHVSVALAGLAVAGLGNAGLRFFHPGDASVIILVWHAGVAFALTALAGVLGRMVLNWRGALRRALPGRA